MAVTLRLSALLILLRCVLSTTQAFRVLGGDEQVPMEDLKFSNYFKLVEMALKDGESATVEMVEDEQMLIAQHGANIILDCSQFMLSSGRPVSSNMEWKEFRLAPGSDGILVQSPWPRFFASSSRILISGEMGRFLNITSANIVSGGEVDDTGIYTCTVCSTSGCRSASVLIYLLGTLFELKEGEENAAPTSSKIADKVYNIGTNFCVEEGSTETIELRCDTTAVNSTLPFPYPNPPRTWALNGTTVYSRFRANNGFFTNTVLRRNVVSPRPLQLHFGSLLMNFEARSLNFPQLAPGTSEETFQSDVLEAMLGSWTCTVSSELQSETATTVITRC